MKMSSKVLLIGAAVVGLAVIGLVVLVGPSSRVSPMPTPNGFDDLMQAADSIQSPPGADGDLEPKTREERRSLLASNAPVLRLVREGLTKEIQVPTTNDLASSLPIDQCSELKRLARLLAVDARLAADEGDATNTLNASLALFDLGNKGTRGGLVIHGLVGVAIRSMACRAMEDVIRLENPAVCRMAGRTMLEKLVPAPTSADYLANERTWRRSLPFGTRLGGQLAELLSGSIRKTEEKFALRVDQQRQNEVSLVRDFAATAFRLEHGRAATNWTELVPEYLPEIPRNAANETPLPLIAP